ncbi:CsbD family protein [Amnibacterium kyonggiense]
MALGDKAKDAVQQVAGKAEEAVGKRTDDAELTGQGQKDQAMGQDRMDTEKAKDDADVD